MKIYGLAGTNGAGKDSLADMLAERHNFFVVSATDMLKNELEKRGLPTDRVHKSQLSAEWRREFGLAVIVDKAYETYAAVKDKYDGMIVGSLRHPAEADEIHKFGGEVLWVDADPKIRYDRIQRGNRGRLEDQKTFEEFLVDEEREMHPEGDEATLNGAAVRERADITIINNGDLVKDFQDEAEKILGLT